MIRALTGAAGLATALNICFSAPAAKAADLYGEDYRYQERSYDDYEDQRTADRYREEPYGERYEQAPQYGYRGSTKDGDYLPPMERPPRYSEPRYEQRHSEPRYEQWRDRHACAPRWEVRRRLQADGWRNFERLAVRPRIVILRAERPNGRAFDLKLDRCSGEVLAERPTRTRGYGAYGPGPRRFGWAY